MKIDVIEQKKNPFLKRTDLMLMIDHTGSATPKEEELKKEIAQKFKSGPDHVEVVYIFTQAGIAKSKVKSRIWEGKTPVKKVKKPKVEKPKEEPKPEEKPKEEAKPEEKKPEEKAEEKKVEEKPKEEVKPKVEEKPKEKPPEKPPEKKEEPKKLEKPPKKKEGEKK